MPNEQFQRDFSVTVGTVKISARVPDDEKTGASASSSTYVARPTLRCEFKIEKTLEPKPNKASVSIWNLSEDSRSSLQTKRVPVIVEAGYVGNVGEIFRGKLRVASHARRGPDWVSTFESGDGGDEFTSKRIRESFKPGAKVSQIMKTVADKMGLGLGNAIKKIDGGDFRGGIEEFKKGIVLNGSASDLFDNLIASAGFDWSIQDEQLLILRADETTEDQAIELTPATGLLGSPVIGEKGVLTGQALLNPNANPGRKIRVLTDAVDGFYKVTKAKFSGDSANDSPWFTDFEARPI